LHGDVQEKKHTGHVVVFWEPSFEVDYTKKAFFRRPRGKFPLSHLPVVFFLPILAEKESNFC